MRKLLTVVAGLALALPVTALAASISGVGTAIFSGQTNLYGSAGQSVQVNTNFDITGGEVLHAIQTDFIGDFVGPVCHDVGIVEGAQTNVAEAFTEMLPPNAGDYGFTMKAYTAATVPQANALNQNPGTACTGSNTSVYNQSSVVHVLPNGTSGSSGGTASMTMQQQIADAVIAAFKAMGFGGAGTTTPAPTPGPSVNCAALYAKQPGTSFGVYNDANVSLQGFLLSWNPNSIPALKAGSTVPMGFYGNQTAKAVSDFKTANSCI